MSLENDTPVSQFSPLLAKPSRIMVEPLVVEDNLLDAIHSAKIAGMGLSEVTDILGTLWNMDE